MIRIPSYKSIPVLQSFMLIVIIFQYFVTIGNDSLYTTFLSIELLMIYSLLLLSSIRRRGLFDLYSLLLFTMGLFTYGEIIFSFIDPSVDYRITYIGEALSFKEDTIQKAMLVYCAYMLSLDIGIKCFERNNTRREIFQVAFDVNVYKIGKLLLLLFAAFAFYRAYIQFQMLSSNRYLLFQGGSAGLEIPLVIRITSTFFLFGYYIFTASKPPLKHFIWATIVYVMVQIPDLLVGNRMALGVLFLYVIWMAVHVYNYKINVKKLVIPIVVIILIFQYIGMSRVDMDTSGIGIVGLIIKFLTMQATSFGLLCTYIQYTPDISGPYPFVFDSLIGGLTGYTGQSEAVLAHRAGIGHQLVYEISPDYYLSGASSGTSCVTELYEFGIVGVIVGALVFAYMIYLFQKHFTHSRLLLLFSCSIFSVVVTSPRSGMFLPLYEIIRSFVFVWVAFKCYYYVSGRTIRLLSWIKELKRK